MSAGFLGRAGVLLGRVVVSFGLGAYGAAGASGTGGSGTGGSGTGGSGTGGSGTGGGSAGPGRDACITVTFGTHTIIAVSHPERC